MLIVIDVFTRTQFHYKELEEIQTATLNRN